MENIATSASPRPSTGRSLTKDIAEMHLFLRAQNQQEHIKELSHQPLWITMSAILFDWAMILGSVALTAYVSWWFFPLSLILIGSRQRALMILIHEASHFLLSRNHELNDRLASIFICPPLLKSIATYRHGHNDHHKYLGDDEKDGDFLHDPEALKEGWFKFYTDHLFSRNASVVKSTVGTLNRMKRDDYVSLLAWWSFFLGATAFVAGIEFAFAFILLWGVARFTVYNAINKFVMLSDHVGLFPGSILGFTRNHPTSSPVRWLFHPHENGFHLTHHLMPNVPFSKLREAHTMLINWDKYKEAEHCETYFVGKGKKVTDSWMKCVNADIQSASASNIVDSINLDTAVGVH